MERGHAILHQRSSKAGEYERADRPPISRSIASGPIAVDCSATPDASKGAGARLCWPRRERRGLTEAFACQIRGVESRGRDWKQFYGSWLRSLEAPAFCIHPQPGVCNVSRSGYGAAAQGCVTSKLEDSASASCDGGSFRLWHRVKRLENFRSRPSRPLTVLGQQAAFSTR
jgi:hypothetical protein